MTMFGSRFELVLKGGGDFMDVLFVSTLIVLYLTLTATLVFLMVAIIMQLPLPVEYAYPLAISTIIFMLVGINDLRREGEIIERRVREMREIFPKFKGKR